MLNMYKKAFLVAGGDKDNLEAFFLNIHDDELVVGVDEGAFYLLNKGIHVDIAVGDFDSISKEQLSILKKHIGKVVLLPSEKDLTDTEAALEYVFHHYELDEVKLFGVFGGRVDHMISNLWIAFLPQFAKNIEKISFFDKKNKLSFYKPGAYELEKEENKKYLSFISMTALVNLNLKQVKYPLENSNYEHPVALISNEFKSQTMQFTFDEGLLAVIQSSD